MLPLQHCQRYEDFQQALEQLQEAVAVLEGEKVTLRQRFQAVQELFQRQIATLSADEIAPDVAPRWQSVQTEIYKQMRLLQTDIMLLQASRSSATSQSRVSHVRDRLNTLMQYCQVLIQL